MLARGVEFEQFGPVHVMKDPPEGEQEPVFGWLTSQPGMTEEVSWNFNKWLIGRDGELLGRWTQGTEPEDLIPQIEAALAESP